MRDSKGRFIKGHEVPQDWKNISSKAHTGLVCHNTPHSEETKRAISESHIKSGRFVKENNPAWKGGTSMKKRYTDSYEVKSWRISVFERDDYTCQVCHTRGCELNAHHIKTWNNYEHLRFNINNGITLCVKCHNKTKMNEKSFAEMFNTINASKEENKMKTNIMEKGD